MLGVVVDVGTGRGAEIHRLPRMPIGVDAQTPGEWCWTRADAQTRIPRRIDREELRTAVKGHLGFYKIFQGRTSAEI